MKTIKTEQLWFRSDLATRKKLEKLAAAQKRTLSNYIEFILLDHIEYMERREGIGGKT